MLYGTDHIIYIACVTVVFAAVVLSEIFLCKTERTKLILLKSVAVVQLCAIISNRISLAVWKENALELIPNTYCGMTSLLLPIAVLFGKRDNIAYHFLFYVEIFGGIVVTFYPNFLSQGPSFWFYPTLSGMLHHSIGFMLCILICLCKRFTPKLSRWWAFPAGMGIYTVFGLFLLDELGIPETMQIDSPIIAGTPLKWWFIILVASAILFVFLFAFEFVCKRAKKNKERSSIVSDEPIDKSCDYEKESDAA